MQKSVHQHKLLTKRFIMFEMSQMNDKQVLAFVAQLYWLIRFN